MGQSRKPSHTIVRSEGPGLGQAAGRAFVPIPTSRPVASTCWRGAAGRGTALANNPSGIPADRVDLLAIGVIQS